jgi:hypothetical protein
MTDFRDDLHPRANDGKFEKKEGWPPEVELENFIADSTLSGDIVGFRGNPDSPAVASLVEEEEFPLGYGRADDEETERILRWVEAEGVTATANYQGFGQSANASGEASGRDTHNYDVTLRTDDGREFNIEYHMGSALTEAPTIAQILQSSASDAHSVEDYDKASYIREMSEFTEYGVEEEDTQRGDAFYKALSEQNSAFSDFVGDDYDFIVYGSE